MTTNPEFVQYEVLVELLDYDPKTGLFERRKTGKVAGFLCDGYVYLHVAGRRYKASHLAWFYMTRQWPKNQIDHRDGDSLNDRFDNLREATSRENNSNMPRHRAGYLVGTTYNKYARRKKCWMARIMIKGRDRHIGYFHTQIEAHEAYIAEKTKLGL